MFLDEAGFFSASGGKASLKKKIYGVVWFVLLMTQFSVIAFALQNPSFFLILNPPDKSGADKINGYVASAEAPVLVEYNGFAVLNGKQALIDSFLMSQLEKRGLWDSSLLVSDCRSKKFSIIVIYGNLYSISGLTQCVHEYYALEDEIPYTDYFVARVYRRK